MTPPIPPNRDFRVVVEKTGSNGDLRVRLYGDLDQSNRDQLDVALAGLGGQAAGVVVDVSGLGLLTVAGVRLLSGYVDTAAGRLSLAALAGCFPARVLRLVGVDFTELPAGADESAGHDRVR